MEAITSLAQLAEHVRYKGTKTRVAVAVAEDANTFSSIARATREGFVQPILTGNRQRILELCHSEGEDASAFTILDFPDDISATREAVRMVKGGEADVLMKGLVGTDKFLKAVLDKQNGLLPPGAVMSYTCALELPTYPKLLFVSDTAVLIQPDLNQMAAMINYSVEMAHRFGIEIPKVALISATEKVGAAMPATMDHALLCKMNQRGQIKNCLVDGPLDVYLACDPTAMETKGVDTPIAGQADVLIFPNLETANAVYKSLTLFAGAELAGLIQGTTKPVVVMSRSESAASKYYCVALSCLIAEEQ